MKLTITVDLDSYDDAKYVLGAAALVQATDILEKIKEFDYPATDAPVAEVLSQTVAFARVWLGHAERGNLDLENLFSVNDGMNIEVWVRAFWLAKIARRQFLRLVERDENYKSRYRKIMATLAEMEAELRDVIEKGPLDNAT